MVVDTQKTLLSAKNIGFFVAIFYALTDIVVDIANGATDFVKTGSIKMLADATIGKLLMSDASIKLKVAELVSGGTNLHHDYVVFLKQSIVKDLIFIFISVYLTYWLLKQISKIFMAESQTNYGLTALILILAIGFTLIGGVAYNYFVHGVMQAPLSGVIDLFRNYNIFSITGTIA